MKGARVDKIHDNGSPHDLNERLVGGGVVVRSDVFVVERKYREGISERAAGLTGPQPG